MSVPKYKRKESPTEFIKELYELNVKCGQIVMNKPRKYRQNYGDFLIKQCLEALYCAQSANDIYVCKTMEESRFQRRCELFYQAIEICNNIPTSATIFLDLVQEKDGYIEECTDNEIFFSDKCQKINSLITGVIKSDKKRYKEYKTK